MIKKWLKKQVTIQEIERSFSEEEKILGPKFASSNKFIQQWEDFKSNLQEGDEIWRFSSPKDTWMNMCGRAGICIVRDGEIVDQMVTVMN